ncbi:PD40 domain-containing protein [candidate division KSB1 bacterium]|nr:PD40 domain-containing protein [candidate division KSB1 bacterium]
MKQFIYLFIFLIFISSCREQTRKQVKNFSKIVFLSDRDAPRRQFDIFMMDTDGGNQVNLTPDIESIVSFSYPVLSPDGNKILYLAYVKDKLLRILNIEEHSVTDLTQVGWDIPQYSFSPQEDKIVFVRKIEGRRQIFIINTDGFGEKCLSDPDFDEYDPAFSPDGSQIVFVSKRSGTFAITIMKKDGTKIRDLVQRKEKIRFPAFSPNGEFVAFISYENNIPGLFMIKSDGRNLKNIIKGKVVESRPQFTPDGSKIVFLARQRGMKYCDVCIINKNGKKFKNLSNDLNFINQYPSITPDGKSIIFQSVKFNNCEIYRVDLNGKNLVNLTNHPKWDMSPSF